MKARHLSFVAAVILALPVQATMIQNGASFPQWELADHTGARVSSASLAGKPYLLWFYPAAMTPGCTAEGRALRDEFEAYRAAGIEILGVSFDAPDANRRFVEKESFPFRLLSDSDRALGIKVGAATSTKQGYARRISYLVGADGKVIKAYEDVRPAEHASQVLADFAASQRR
jgi:peroxiredoxin Q/BCP